jgi:hypothetical protein
MEGPHRRVLPPLHLDDDGFRLDVLRIGIEGDPIPGHDQLLWGHIGLLQGLADRGRIGRTRPVDRIDQREKAGEGTGGREVRRRKSSANNQY